MLVGIINSATMFAPSFEAHWPLWHTIDILQTIRDSPAGIIVRPDDEMYDVFEDSTDREEDEDGNLGGGDYEPEDGDTDEEEEEEEYEEDESSGLESDGDHGVWA